MYPYQVLRMRSNKTKDMPCIPTKSYACALTKQRTCHVSLPSLTHARSRHVLEQRVYVQAKAETEFPAI
jgi:hypothetical protein